VALTEHEVEDSNGNKTTVLLNEEDSQRLADGSLGFQKVGTKAAADKDAEKAAVEFEKARDQADTKARTAQNKSATPSTK
jgi:hypothetical protein